MNMIHHSSRFIKLCRRVFLFSMCIVSTGLMAQGNEYGIRVGIQASTTYNQGNMVEEGFTSMYGGVFFGKQIGSTFFTSWITGLDYMQCGYLRDKDYFRRIHYLGIPQALRFHFGPFHLQAGVSLNLKIAEKLVENGIPISGNSYQTSWFDMPILAGAGVQIMDAFLDFRFYYGWLDIHQGNNNIYCQLGLGYSFR